MQARAAATEAGLRVTTGRIGTRPVALAVCGMGKVNAARAAQVLCSSFRPSLLAMSGGAGALAPDLRVGDVVVADSVVQYDLGAWTGQGFRPAGRGAAWPAARGRRPGTPACRVGPICSGDQLLAEPGKRAELHRRFQALAVDMESAGLAQVAAANGIPWLVVRGISDAVGDNEALGLELPLVVAPLTLLGAIEIYGGLARQLASSPARIGQLRVFLRRFRQAARAAAEVCVALVGEPT